MKQNSLHRGNPFNSAREKDDQECAFFYLSNAKVLEPKYKRY